jgi:hypothetical protein
MPSASSQRQPTLKSRCRSRAAAGPGELERLSSRSGEEALSTVALLRVQQGLLRYSGASLDARRRWRRPRLRVVCLLLACLIERSLVPSCLMRATDNPRVGAMDVSQCVTANPLDWLMDSLTGLGQPGTGPVLERPAPIFPARSLHSGRGFFLAHSNQMRGLIRAARWLGGRRKATRRTGSFARVPPLLFGPGILPPRVDSIQPT